MEGRFADDAAFSYFFRGEFKLGLDQHHRASAGPEDLKGPALLLCSDAGRHITGQVLAVDGGVMAA